MGRAVAIACLGAASLLACGGGAPEPVSAAAIERPAPTQSPVPAAREPVVAFEIAVIDPTDPCAWLDSAALPKHVTFASSKSQVVTMINGVREDRETSQCAMRANAVLSAKDVRAVLAAFHPPASHGVVLDDRFFQYVAATTAREPITDGDVTDAKRNDPPPETFTDLFGEKKVLHVHGIDMDISAAASARVSPLLSTKNVEPVVIVDGRLTACRVGVKQSSLVIRCGPTTMTSVSVKDGVMDRHEHTAEDYADLILERLGRASPR